MSRIFTVAALLVALFLSGHAAAAPALPGALVNAGFEEGLAGWRAWYARQPVTVSFPDGPTGKYLHMLGKMGSRVSVSQGITPAEPGRWYRARLRYQAGPNGAGGGSFGFSRVSVRDPNGKFVDYPCAMSLLDTFGEWATAEKRFRAPLCAAQITIELNSGGACDLRVDDVALEPVAPPELPRNTWAQLAEPRAVPLVFPSWQYNNSADQFRRMGLKYAWRYGYDEQFDELKESRTIGFWGGEAVHRRYAERGLRACVYLYYGALDYRKAHYDGEPPADIPRMLDPAWHDGYVQACREACERYGKSPGIDYFFVVDEASGAYRGGILPREKRVSPFWAQLDAEVRERFGGGEHGLPDGPGDANPYRWIAYESWAGQQLAGTFARLRRVIDDSGCGAKLLGPDEAGMLYPLPWADLARSADAFTGQSLSTSYTARAHTAGFLTKCAADMTGKPVLHAGQIVAYGGSPSPEEVQRRYSQIVQNGGDGPMLIAVEWFDRELSHHRYSAPERWATVKNALRLMAAHRVRTPAESRVGILFSCPSAQAMGTKVTDHEILTAYALCGPVARAWPRMLDSAAVAKGQASFAGLDVVVVPYAPYERPEVVRALEAFVRGGGLLVCCDPGAFGHDTLGGALDAARLLGAVSAAGPPQRSVSLAWPARSRQRVYGGECFTLRPAAGARVVGQYEGGEPAAVLHDFGKGQVLLFGANPLATAAADDPEWGAWWREVLRAQRVPLDLPIWDLRLPDEALAHAEAPADRCLTGNSLVRCQNGAYLGANEPAGGFYTLDPAPDLSRERAPGRQIAFSEGNLTNRLEAEKGLAGESRVAEKSFTEADWADRWSREALAKGLTVEFVLTEARDLTRLRLWYSGALPNCVVEGATDSGWAPLGRMRAQDAGEDVADLELPFAGRYSRLRLRFDPGTGALALAEVEVWGTAGPGK